MQAGYFFSLMLTAMLTSSAASAATIRSSVNKEGRAIVSITGEIALGDVDQLKAIIKSANIKADN